MLSLWFTQHKQIGANRAEGSTLSMASPRISLVPWYASVCLSVSSSVGSVSLENLNELHTYTHTHTLNKNTTYLICLHTVKSGILYSPLLQKKTIADYDSLTGFHTCKAFPSLFPMLSVPSHCLNSRHPHES